MMKINKKEFGDFQTPYSLAFEVSGFVQSIFPSPASIVEPNCGKGSFLKAALETWGLAPVYFGFDINSEYIKLLKDEITYEEFHFEKLNFFKKNWRVFFQSIPGKVLVIGNPPWVTNSSLSSVNSENLPRKSNFQKLKGWDSKTGKANFDIAEWIIITLIEALQNKDAYISMLCKTATARKVLKYFWMKDFSLSETSIHTIDAAKHFGVAVDACLLVTKTSKCVVEKTAKIYSSIDYKNFKKSFGIFKNELISDIEKFRKFDYLNSNIKYGWRSGLKHDAAKVMELKHTGSGYFNGFNEKCDIEEDYLYPLLKSSDIGNGRCKPRKHVIVPQHRTTDDTYKIQSEAPKTWEYLKRYMNILDNRKSIIYKNRPRFSIFGIGDYSFAPWKVAVSGLYKKPKFVVVGPEYLKPVMLDDTCYFLPVAKRETAEVICELLNSYECISFLESLVFFDSKRPVNIDILNRINIDRLAKINNHLLNMEDIAFNDKVMLF